jgi:hypothetical protein
MRRDMSMQSGAQAVSWSIPVNKDVPPDSWVDGFTLKAFRANGVETWIAREVGHYLIIHTI